MVICKNELINIPETQAYVDFGLEQVEKINKRFDSWLAQQSFANKGACSRFGKMIVSGNSDNREYKDCIKWDLHFLNEAGNKYLSDALLQEHRYQNIPTFNSKPQLFSTANYIEISVTNGEKGWVKKGDFPINVHIGKDYDVREKDPLKIPPDIAIHTDVRREALAGFEAAYQWQCFREMAIGSYNFITTQLAKEFRSKVQDYDSNQHLHSRKENVYPLFLELLPNTRLEKGDSALKPFYKPGTLEGALALELEHFMRHEHGITKTGDIRPIYSIKGYPIQINQTSDKSYNALMSFDVQTVSYGLDNEDDEQVKRAVENQLAKHYAIGLTTPTKMQVALHLIDAHKVEKEIRKGAVDTEIHRFARGFGDALRHTVQTLDEWYNNKIPELKEKYGGRVNSEREAHFLGLGEKLESKVGVEV